MNGTRSRKDSPAPHTEELNRPRVNPSYMDIEDTECTRYRSDVLARGGRSSLERQEGEVKADWGWVSVMAEDQ